MHRSGRHLCAAAAAAVVAVLAAAIGSPGVSAVAVDASPWGVRVELGQPGDESKEIRSAIAQFYGARTAPGNIAPGAYTAAYDHVADMGVLQTSWTEVTNRPYNADSPNYRDPVASNSSGGFGYVAGRVTGIAVDGDWVYAGGAEGGVFRSPDGGASWTPISDALPALATGDLRLAPDGSLWLATGEADLGDGLGGGVYRLADPHDGSFDRTMRVGGVELESHIVNKLELDDIGHAYAATSRGLYRHASDSSSGAWELVVSAVPQDDPSLVSYSNITNDVVLRPGTGGRTVVMNLAFVGGAPQNGIYVSNRHGVAGSFTKVSPKGAISSRDVGAASLAYSADGTRLYVLLQSPRLFNDPKASTTLAGVFVSPTGDPAGPYKQVATSSKLAQSGSAQKITRIGKGYGPGVQAWYNRFIAVDPQDAEHVYVGLEEVYETRDGGTSWSTIGRYYDFGFPCWSYLDRLNTCDGNVLHPDQHSVAFGNGRVYAGNDGGLYSRSTAADASSWDSLSRSGQLATLQYYSVGVGKVPGGVAVWGGLQDNGISLLSPADAEMVSPFGGDGGDQIVDPENGCNTAGEFIYLHIQVTNTCGRSDGSTAEVRIIDPLDPDPQFIAPFAADSVDPGFWVAGGQFVWGNTKTWASDKGSDWFVIGDNGDFGAGIHHSATAIASQDHVVWAGWCGSCLASSWQSGITTTYGTGELHQAGNVVVNSASGRLPNRYVAGITIDPSDRTGATVYAVYNGFSAHWVEGPGAGIGHVFKTTDGGATWRDISGSPTVATGLPDVPASHLAITPSHALVLTTDVGVFATTDDGTSWRRLGTSLPYTIATDVRVGPDGNTYVATFGRGIWSTPTPGGAQG